MRRTALAEQAAGRTSLDVRAQLVATREHERRSLPRPSRQRNLPRPSRRAR
jgi:hypothetical protein